MPPPLPLVSHSRAPGGDINNGKDLFVHQSEINKLWPEYYKTMVEGDMVRQTLSSSGLWFVSVLCVVFCDRLILLRPGEIFFSCGIFY